MLHSSHFAWGQHFVSAKFNTGNWTNDVHSHETHTLHKNQDITTPPITVDLKG